MKEEIGAAVLFITRLIRINSSISSEKVIKFSNSLSAILNEKFQNHWYQDHPTKGQGYRCISINSAESIDPVLKRAAKTSGLRYQDLRLPFELTLWVDPKHVCCRFGERRGSLMATTKDGNLENMAQSINYEELLKKETERHNQQVNNINRSQVKFSKSVHNYCKFQNNFYNNWQFENTYYRFCPQNNNQRPPKHEEQVNGVRISPDHVNEIRQQFMDQVNSVVKKGEKVCPPKSDDTTAVAKDTKSATSSTTPTVSSASMSADVSKPINDNAKLNKEATKANNNNGGKSSVDSSKSDKSSTYTTKPSKPSQAKGRYQPDQNTSVKPGSYNRGRGTRYFYRSTHSKFNSQKVY